MMNSRIWLNKYFASKDGVSICENLILMCQTAYSREEIDAATQNAEEKLAAKLLCLIFAPHFTTPIFTFCLNSLRVYLFLIILAHYI